VLPHESYLNFQGIIRKDSPNGPTTENVTTFFKNNSMAYFLDEIKYEINKCGIDKTRFVGMTTTLQNFISLDNLQSQNSGWSSGDEISPLQLFCTIKKICWDLLENSMSNFERFLKN